MLKISFGVTNPAEITNFAASSTDISKKTISFSGKNSKKPEVGFGVVGKKILCRSLFSPNLLFTSPFFFVETDGESSL